MCSITDKGGIYKGHSLFGVGADEEISQGGLGVQRPTN